MKSLCRLFSVLASITVYITVQTRSTTILRLSLSHVTPEPQATHASQEISLHEFPNHPHAMHSRKTRNHDRFLASSDRLPHPISNRDVLTGFSRIAAADVQIARFCVPQVFNRSTCHNSIIAVLDALTRSLGGNTQLSFVH